MAVETLNQEWLERHGVSAATEEMRELLAIANDEYAQRVGEVIAGKLSGEQLVEFTKLEDSDDAKIAWLTKAFPDYPKIVRQELARLGEDIDAAADKTVLIRNWEE